MPLGARALQVTKTRAFARRSSGPGEPRQPRSSSSWTGLSESWTQHVEGVVYLTAPDLALELADLRLIVRHADFTSVAQLGAERFHGCPAGGVIALLPRPFESSGKGELVRRSFVDVKRWRRVPLAGGSEIEGWVGACDGGSGG